MLQGKTRQQLTQQECKNTTYVSRPMVWLSSCIGIFRSHSGDRRNLMSGPVRPEQGSLSTEHPHLAPQRHNSAPWDARPRPGRTSQPDTDHDQVQQTARTWTAGSCLSFPTDSIVTNNVRDFRPLRVDTVTSGGHGHFGMIFMAGVVVPIPSHPRVVAGDLHV
jgi:hypothetical protein